MSVSSPVDQYDNAKALIDAIGAAVDAGSEAAFYADMISAMDEGVEAGEHYFQEYGGDFATVKAALPAPEIVGAHHWEITIAGICKQVAFFCCEANDIEAALPGNVAATNHKALIRAYLGTL